MKNTVETWTCDLCATSESCPQDRARPVGWDEFTLRNCLTRMEREFAVCPKCNDATVSRTAQSWFKAFWTRWKRGVVHKK